MSELLVLILSNGMSFADLAAVIEVCLCVFVVYVLVCV